MSTLWKGTKGATIMPTSNHSGQENEFPFTTTMLLSFFEFLPAVDCLVALFSVLLVK